MVPVTSNTRELLAALGFKAQRTEPQWNLELGKRDHLIAAIMAEGYSHCHSIDQKYAGKRKEETVSSLSLAILQSILVPPLDEPNQKQHDKQAWIRLKG